jgi:hypothetical protein
VRRWLEEEGVEVVAKKIRVYRKNDDLGAIQDFSGSQRTQWMDGIIIPHPRREAWLDKLRQLSDTDESTTTPNEGEIKWSEKDWKHIKLSSDLAFLSAAIFREEMRQEAKA